MSELIAEARVLIRPDTTRFTAELEAQVNAATKAARIAPVVVPVTATAPVAAGTAGAAQAAAAAQAEVAASAESASGAIAAESAALETNTAALGKNAAANVVTSDAVAGATVARERGAASLAAQSTALTGVGRGAGSAAAALVGVRGATLAATGPFIAGAAAAITLAKAVSAFSSLQSELNVFRVTAGATADEMKRVSNEAQALGRDVSLPAVGAQDAAEAMTELSKAGLSVQDSIDGARGVLQLATAAAISNADAVQIAASALNAFGLSGDQAVHVADVLTNAANSAQGSISDMGLSLQQAAAVAKQVGLSFEDTLALLTELAKAGLRGSDAGTSLRVSLIKLIAPSKQAADVLKQLNVHLRDAQGNIRPDVFNQFAAAQANLSKAQQDANAAIVFGTDGLRAYSIIARNGLPALQQTREELARQGSAAELAGARMAGLAGAAENLKNQLSALGLVVGGGLAPSITKAANSLGGAIGDVTAFAQAIGPLIGQVVSLEQKLVSLSKIPGTDFALLGSPFVNAAKALGALGGLLADTGTDLKVARLAVQGLVADLNKVGGFTNVNQTVVSLQKLADEFRGGDKQSQAFAASIDTLIKRIQNAAAAADGNPINIKVNIPPEVLSGKVGADAATATATGFNDQMRTGFGRLPGFLQTALDGAKPIATAAGSEAGKLFGAGFKTTATASVSEAVQSSVDLAVAKSQGDQGKQLQILLAQRQRQQKFLNNVLNRTATTPVQAAKNAALQKEAADQLTQTKAQITAIFSARNQAVQQAAAAAKSQSDKAAAALAKARTEADQKILDAVQGRSTALDLRQTAAVTPKEQLAVQIAIANQASREIAFIEKNVKDQKTRATAIAAEVQALAAAGAQITALTAQIAKNAADSAAAKQAARDAGKEADLENAALLAQLTTSDKDDERVLRKQIQLFANRAKRLGLATLAGKQAKNQALQFVKQLRDLLLARKKITDTQQEASRGPSAFDILTENAQIFQQTGGNLITGNQPFAGPTGFTADIAQFLHRGAQPQLTVTTKQDPNAAAQNASIDRQIQRLIDALNLNTSALTGSRKGVPGAVQQGGRSDIGLGGGLAWRWRQQVEADNG